MEKCIRLLVLLILLTGSIDAQFIGGRRLVFLGDRALALRRAFPFGVPLAFRRGFIPSSLAQRIRLARLASLRRSRSRSRRPFAFGPEPFPFDGFGGGFPSSPFGSGAAFSPGFFDGGRFVGSSPFDAGAFGTAGGAGFFPPGTEFPAGSGFVDGGVPPGGAGFTPTGDVSGTTGPAGGTQPTTGVTGGAGQMGPTDITGSPNVPQIPSGVPTDGSGGFAGPGAMTPDMTSTGAGFTGTGTGMAGPGMTGPGMTGPGMTGAGMTGAGMTGAGMSGAGMTGPGMTGPGMTGPGMTGAGMTGPGMTGAGMTGSGMSGAGMTGPGMTGSGMTGVGMGGPGMATPGMTAPGMTGPTFGGFPTMFPAGTTFGTGFGRPITAPFPTGAGATGGFAGTAAPNGRFPGATAGFGRGFAPSDRTGFGMGAPGAMTVDGRFVGTGAVPSGPAAGFPAGSTFSGDPRFGGFAPTAGFGGRGPAFSTPGAPTDPNFNLQFQPLSGSGMTGAPGQFGGFQGAGGFQAGSGVGNPNPGMPSGNNNNFNSFTGNTNNQVVPSSGTGAARIDGFGTVSSTNNLNTDPNNVIATNTNANTNNPSGIIRFEAGSTNSASEVVINDANANVPGSSEFRVVEVNNILDKPGNSGSVSSSDQSVVDSMGFNAAGDANIAQSDLAATSVVSDNNQPINDNMAISSPITNTDFSFFVPPENTNTNSASVDQGATFSAPAPPPPPPIMVPSDNTAGIPITNEVVKPSKGIGFITHEPTVGSDLLTFPIIGTDNAVPMESQPNTEIYDNINNQLPTNQGNLEEMLQPTGSTGMTSQNDIGNVM